MIIANNEQRWGVNLFTFGCSQAISSLSARRPTPNSSTQGWMRSNTLLSLPMKDRFYCLPEVFYLFDTVHCKKKGIL